MNFMNLTGCSSEEIYKLTRDELLSYDFLKAANEIADVPERTRVRTLITLAAKEKGIEKDIKKYFKESDELRAKLDAKYLESLNHQTNFWFLENQFDCGHWVADNDGVRSVNRDGVVKYASRIPMVPVAILENDSTGIEKVMIEFSKDGHSKKSIICDRNTVASANKIVSLANKGLEVTSENAKLQVKYISDIITENIQSIDRFKAYSQLGWCGTGFVPYASDAIFDGEETNRHIFQSIAEKGDFELWKKTMGVLRSNEIIRLAMAASFASVLIERVKGLPFVFHLWGLTGTGKTVALKIAMSIWGNPRMGKLVRTMNMTQNSMLSTAAFLNNIPFAGDELQTIKSRWADYDQLIMQITEGINRGRMTYDKMEETKTWNCSFLFTGEDPCTHISSGGGVKNRVIEVEVTAPLFDSPSGNEITSIVENNYGHAGRTFVDYISTIDDVELIKMFRILSSELIKTAGTTEKQASSMALMILADKLACDCIFTDESPYCIDDAVKHLVNADEVDVAERAYQWLFDFIAKNQIRFEIENNHGEVWGKREDDVVLFNVDAIQSALSSANFDFNSVKKKWAAKGYLIMDKNRFSHRTTIFGRFKARYVKLVIPKEEAKEDLTDYAEDIPF
ncbi:MAG: DUF927 domain-containing protein [Clostridiaceae bacterium]|nr:DUF927 domain-containing protein [Clostridiaceae bacterium]